MQLYILWYEYLTIAFKLERNLLLMLDGHKSWALSHLLDVHNKQNSRSVISTQSFSLMKDPTNDVSKPFALYFVSCLALVFLLNHRAHFLYWPSNCFPTWAQQWDFWLLCHFVHRGEQLWMNLETEVIYDFTLVTHSVRSRTYICR